jgi:hypothetical protein
MEVGEVFDQLAFLGASNKDLVGIVATAVWKARNPREDTSAFIFWPKREDIEKVVAEWVARYGGRLGGMTRKNFINAVDRELVKRERRKARKEGKVPYFFR